MCCRPTPARSRIALALRLPERLATAAAAALAIPSCLQGWIKRDSLIHDDGQRCYANHGIIAR